MYVRGATEINIQHHILGEFRDVLFERWRYNRVCTHRLQNTAQMINMICELLEYLPILPSSLSHN